MKFYGVFERFNGILWIFTTFFMESKFNCLIFFVSFLGFLIFFAVNAIKRKVKNQQKPKIKTKDLIKNRNTP